MSFLSPSSKLFLFYSVRGDTLCTSSLTLSLLAAVPLLITFANSLDPDQGQQNVGPDLDPNSLTVILTV